MMKCFENKTKYKKILEKFGCDLQLTIVKYTITKWRVLLWYIHYTHVHLKFTTKGPEHNTDCYIDIIVDYCNNCHINTVAFIYNDKAMGMCQFNNIHIMEILSSYLQHYIKYFRSIVYYINAFVCLSLNQFTSLYCNCHNEIDNYSFIK